MRRCGLIAVGMLLATLVAADAQQSDVTSNRLMFDPAGLQNPDSRKFTPRSASPTTGQSAAPRQPAAAAPALKQSIAPPPEATPAATPAAKPRPPARATSRAPARPASARQPAQAASDTERATTNTARSTERPIPREQPGALGRVSLPEGSLGFEGKTQLKDYDMSDGRKVPGFENIQRNDSSYFGLSLRMPTGGGSSYSSSSSSPSLSPPSLFRDHGPN